MSPFNHFDFIAPYYDRVIQPTDPTKFCALAGLPTAGLLLDVGGGTGRITHPLLKMVKGVVIADSSEGMLTQAHKKGGLVTICSESERLPFDDESFERVIMVDAFHHVYDYHVTSSELWRVVKPGGRILIEEPDIQTAAVKLMAILEKILLMRSHFISPQKIAVRFDQSTAKVKIEQEDSTAWIIIDKQAERR